MFNFIPTCTQISFISTGPKTNEKFAKLTFPQYIGIPLENDTLYLDRNRASLSILFIWHFQDEPKVGEYKKIDIKMNGYDYVVLESFSKFMKSVSTTMDLDMKV